MGSVLTIDTNDNAFGRCLKRVKDGWDATYSYYDGEKELLECGSGGGAAFKNVYGKGIDEILARTDTTLAQTVYYQQDQNGNVTHLSGVGGAVIEKYQYDAFGRPVIYNASGAELTASAYGNPFLFTGRRYQSTLGFYQYRARAYHPRLGRFTSEDPTLYDAGDYNLFRYCHNDPLDLTDPMGTQEQYHETLAHSRDRAQEMTIGERISRWQQSMESSIRGEWASRTLQNLSMGQQSAGPKKFGSWQDAGRAGGTEAVPLARADKEHREWGGSIGQSRSDSNVFTYGRPVRGTVEYIDDGHSKAGRYNVTDFTKSKLPDGFRMVGGYWALPYHQGGWPSGDQGRLWSHEMNGVLAIPPWHGAVGAANRPVFKYYPYVPGSPYPE
jgi:RHS repeat-associated protein